jgi:PKD repeat protein
MKTKWNILMILALLAMLVGGMTSPVAAQETHYFSWQPDPISEGGGATFYATLPDNPGVAEFEWSRSINPGGTDCDYQMGTGSVNGGPQVYFVKSGVYTVCLDYWSDYANGTGYVHDSQLVTVQNVPPALDYMEFSSNPGYVGRPIDVITHFLDQDDIFTCTVDFGDGTNLAGTIMGYECDSPSHTYTSAGTYTVAVTVRETLIVYSSWSEDVVISTIPSNAMWIQSVNGTGKAGRGSNTYTGKVVIGSLSGPVSKASVTVVWFDPTIEPPVFVQQTASTSRAGAASFTYKSKLKDIMVCVKDETSIVKKGMTYMPEYDMFNPCAEIVLP